MSSIERAERLLGHDRTVVMGDFNMNPFDPGMVCSSAFHGVMSRMVTQVGSRVVRGQSYKYFYNPMWSLYGDLPTAPPGSFFYSASDHKEYFWHMFDQVLVRPSIQEWVQPASIQVLTTAGVSLYPS